MGGVVVLRLVGWWDSSGSSGGIALSKVVG